MTIGKWLLNAKVRNNLTAVEYKQNHKWHKMTWPEYCNRVVSAYLYLKQLGLKSKSHVGLVSNTRWEWAVVDLAVMGGHAISVPMYPTLSDEDLLFTINHSEVEILVIENDQHVLQMERLKPQFERDVKVVRINEINYDLALNDEIRNEFYSYCEKISEQEIATIIYTSGTTGRPKGVVLKHEAVVSEVVEGFELFNVKRNYKSLTFLPFAHILGRIEHWGSIYNGHCIAYAESIDRLKNNLKEVKPDFMIAVPRIFEKVYAGIMAQVETKKLKQTIFNQAMSAAIEVQKYRATKATIPWPLLLKYETLNKLALEPIRAAFGGQLKFAISGGAPIDSQLTQFFYNCGIPILEGYGLSETTGAVTVNSLNSFLVGSVGKPIGDVKIKIAEDGEILIKSKKCLKEYYKSPEETEKVLKDGYFATGDIGEFTTGGFLRITDRKKDLIKTAGGKYVAPQKLEGLLKQEPLISQALIHGDQKKYIIALITFEPAQIEQWAKSQNIEYTSVDELYNNISLKVRIQKHIQATNSKLSSFEAIKKFEILKDTWTVDNGSLTQSLKVKRKFLESRYIDLIKEIYD
jgi:long-chain acyl-CoA synthetase